MLIETTDIIFSELNIVYNFEEFIFISHDFLIFKDLYVLWV